MSEIQQVPPLVFSNNELHNIIKMAETSIVFVQAADKVYELDNGGEPVKLVQIRAAAATIQSKCQTELYRRRVLAEESASRAAEEAKKNAEEKKEG
jgi:hypothetical protein